MSQINNKIVGNITTQNLIPSLGNATANSAVVIPVDALTQTIGVQVAGTYTSGAAGTLFGLIAQATVDGTNWVTLDKFAQIATNIGTNPTFTPPKLWKSNIQSGQTGTYSIKNEGFSAVRICCLSGTVSGTAVVTLNSSQSLFPTDVQFARYQAFTQSIGTNMVNMTGMFWLGGSNKINIVLESFEIHSQNGTVVANNYGNMVNNFQRCTGFVTGGATQLSTVNATDLSFPASLAALQYRSASGTLTGAASPTQLQQVYSVHNHTAITQTMNYFTTPIQPMSLRGAGDIIAVSNANQGGVGLMSCGYKATWIEY